MTPEFYAEYVGSLRICGCCVDSRLRDRYVRASNQNLKRLLWVMNPNKFRACERLVKWHEARGCVLSCVRAVARACVCVLPHTRS
jgi:hypothetical protein